MDERTDGLNSQSDRADAAASNSRLIERLLTPLAYEDLRSFARTLIAREWIAPDVTGTDVVHEAVLRLIAKSKLDLKNPAHLLAVLKRGIRHFLIDQHRRKTALKREHRESTIEPDLVAGADSPFKARNTRVQPAARRRLTIASRRRRTI